MPETSLLDAGNYSVLFRNLYINIRGFMMIYSRADFIYKFLLFTWS